MCLCLWSWWWWLGWRNGPRAKRTMRRRIEVVPVVVKETGVMKQQERKTAGSSSGWMKALSSLSSSWWCLGCLAVCVCGGFGGWQGEADGKKHRGGGRSGERALAATWMGKAGQTHEDDELAICGPYRGGRAGCAAYMCVPQQGCLAHTTSSSSNLPTHTPSLLQSPSLPSTPPSQSHRNGQAQVLPAAPPSCHAALHPAWRHGGASIPK